MKITLFGTQPYDRESFDRANERYGFEFNYHRSHLNGNNALLAQGAESVTAAAVLRTPRPEGKKLEGNKG